MFELERGNTIQSATFESGGLDEDDDNLVFELDFDWGRGNQLRLPADEMHPLSQIPAIYGNRFWFRISWMGMSARG